MEPTNTGNKRISTNKRIVSAKLFSRTIATIIDFAMVAFVGGIFMMGLQPLFGLSDVVTTPKETFTSYWKDSNLYAENKDGDLVPHEFDNYIEYQELFTGYFGDYKVNKAPEEFRINYEEKFGCQFEYWYNVTVLGQSDELGKFSADYLQARPEFVKRDGKQIFEYKKDAVSGETLYNEIGQAKPGDENLAKAKKYYYIPDEENENNEQSVYLFALVDLTNTPYYVSAFEAWNLWFYYVPFFISFVLSSLIFLFIIPMCLKYGRTLGKMMFHLAVVNNLGYDIKKGQIVIRFCLPVLILVFLFIVSQFIPRSLLAFLGFCTILILVSYCLVIFTKDHKAIHDYLALTQVIDANESVWYKDATEEDIVLHRASGVASEAIDDDLDEELEGKNVLYVNHNYGKHEEEKEETNDTSEK